MSRKRRNFKKSKPTYAVVVEGETEFWYLQMLKRNERILNINIEPKIPQKKKLEEQFQIVKTFAKNYTKVFWIIDLDVVLSETKTAKKGLETPLQKLNKFKLKIDDDNDFKNVELIINNPCLEFWFLLHFESTSKSFKNCTATIKQLKKHLKNYEKTRTYYTKQNNDIYLKLKSHLKEAIKNANRMDSFNINEPNKGISQMQVIFQNQQFKQVIL